MSPLLALVDEIRSRPEKAGYDFLWIGTREGVEKPMVEKEGIPYKAIFAGKLRRYFSWKNLLDIIFIKFGFWQALFIMLSWRPDLVITAGGFVSVPVVWAAWILRVPALIHQQDVRPGLANKLMAPFAKVITVTFEKSLADYGKKAVWTGNPVRKNISSPARSNAFKLKQGLPTILIVGGGTGAKFINDLVAGSINKLTKFCQIIHTTGNGKMEKNLPGDIAAEKNYHSFEFLGAEKIAEAMQKADLVITRAGLSTLTELSFLGKPLIIIPIPDSHQEDNARIYAEHDAALVLNQKDLTAEKLIKEIENILSNPQKMTGLKNNISLLSKPRAREDLVKVIEKLINKC